MKPSEYKLLETMAALADRLMEFDDVILDEEMEVLQEYMLIKNGRIDWSRVEAWKQTVK